MNKIKLSIASVASFLPLAVFAQGDTFDTIQGALDSVIYIANAYIIPLIIGLAVIYFLWGVVQYLRDQGDEKVRKEARMKMVWGIIAIFVMTAVWGLVNVLDDTLNLENRIPNLPDVPGPDSNPTDDTGY